MHSNPSLHLVHTLCTLQHDTAPHTAHSINSLIAVLHPCLHVVASLSASGVGICLTASLMALYMRYSDVEGGAILLNATALTNGSSHVGGS